MATKRKPSTRRYYSRPPEPEPEPEPRRLFSWDMNPTTILALVGAAVSALFGYWNTGKIAQDSVNASAKIATDFTTYKVEMDAKLAKSQAGEAIEIAKANAHIDKIDEHVTNVDKSGTDYGRSAYSTQAVERADLKKQVEKQEVLLDEMVPALTRIDANVTWLMQAASGGSSRQAASGPIFKPKTGN